MKRNELIKKRREKKNKEEFRGERNGCWLKTIKCQLGWLITPAHVLNTKQEERRKKKVYLHAEEMTRHGWPILPSLITKTVIKKPNKILNSLCSFFRSCIIRFLMNIFDVATAMPIDTQRIPDVKGIFLLGNQISGNSKIVSWDFLEGLDFLSCCCIVNSNEIIKMKLTWYGRQLVDRIGSQWRTCFYLFIQIFIMKNMIRPEGTWFPLL